jgi:hypothetical protein
LLEGTIAEGIAVGLITLGLGVALLLVFLEVGLGEDRELARERARRRPSPRNAHAEPRLKLGRRPSRRG